MFAQTQSRNLFERFLAWWRAGFDDGWREALDAAEVEHIAREFGLTAEEFSAISRSDNRALGLLHRMMRANGLSYEELRQAHPDVVRDLEIHCSLCSEQRRCRRELESGAAPAGFTEYCPNAPTFVELQAEALQRLV